VIVSTIILELSPRPTEIIMTFLTTNPDLPVCERTAHAFEHAPVAERGQGGRLDRRPEGQGNLDRVAGQKPRTDSGAGP
jgi:hypothetical protein